MAGGSDRLDQMRASINVTPLVDVLLVLLIIFIMVAPIMTKAMESNIPQKAGGSLSSEYSERQLVVYLGAQDQLWLNNERVAPEDLARRLRDLFAQRRGRRLLFVDAAPGIAYGRVVELMDRCRAGGAQTIGIIPDSLHRAPAALPSSL